MHSKKLRDAVHKDIRLDPPLVAAMDTPEMQRLRGIRQLGAAYYVYPGAHHTRFEHGLGTYWMARRIMDQIEEAAPPSAASSATPSTWPPSSTTSPTSRSATPSRTSGACSTATTATACASAT